MEWLNYHHLLYFWTVARAGSVVAAAAQLRLTQPTVSGQIRMLESSLGHKLFERTGRRLVLTEVGRLVFGYADEIFGLGRELLDVINERPTGRPMRLVVGVADQIPKMLVHRLLTPALTLPGGVHVICRDDKTDRLLAALSVHELDVVLADAPMRPGVSVKAFSHMLGECGVTFFATRSLAAKLRPGFPKSLAGAPLVLPTENATLRRSVDQWLSAEELRPRIVAEIEDSAVLKAFGRAGLGVFPAPSVVEADVRKQYGVSVVGRVESVRERFYLMSVEKRLTHPAVVAITRAARHDLFGTARQQAVGSRRQAD